MQHVATRYMTRFACTGPACEDNCCHGWAVTVDEEHYEVLRARMTKASPDGQAEFSAKVQPLVPRQHRQLHALMVLSDDGRCSMQSREGWCEVQARYGESALSNSCATFPRIMGRLGTRFELVGNLSCPEVARLALLSEDGMALLPVDAGGEMMGRGLIHREIDQKTTENYERALYPVRTACLELLALDAYPLSSRLFFIAFLADKTWDFLRPRIPEEKFRTRELVQLLAALAEPANRDRLHDQFLEVSVDETFAISVARAFLSLPKAMVPAVLRGIMDGLGGMDKGEAGGDVSDGSGVDPLMITYCQKRARLPAPIAARLDTILTRYATQYFLRSWFTLERSFMAYVQGLFVRLAVLRVLITSQCAEPAANVEDDARLDVDAFDRLAVRAVYSFSRLLEHDGLLASRLVENLEQQGMMDFMHAIALLKL